MTAKSKCQVETASTQVCNGSKYTGKSLRQLGDSLCSIRSFAIVLEKPKIL